MDKKFPLFLALGASFAFVMAYQQRRRAANFQAWSDQVESRPGTALITGGSSGIGEAFASALARQGYHLVLVARGEERLRAAAEQIRSMNPVQVDIIPADLSDPADLERVASYVTQIPDLDLLVNNAGFGTGGDFAEIDVQPELKMIRLHVIASVRLSRAALPGMIVRGHGGIINVSSVASLLPMPGNATYGATKNYLNFFTRSLNAELTGTGVRVEALCPGFTMSDFHDVQKVDRSTIPGFMWMQADDVVFEALQGLRQGRQRVIPGLIYKLIALILRIPGIEILAHRIQRMRLVRQWQGAEPAAQVMPPE